MKIPAKEKINKIPKVSSQKVLVVIIFILLFPALLLALPFYYIFTKLKFEGIFKLFLSTLITTLYLGIFLLLVVRLQPNLIKISTSNLYLFNTSKPTELLNPKVADKKTKTREYADGEYFVTRVIDGDTIELSDGTKLRYIGINAPEITKKIECYGEKAKQKNVSLVLNKKVRIVKDISEKDKYDRLLRYVYVGKIFVNKTLVEEGYANAATYQPDVKFQDLFVTVQKEAQQKNIGLWKDCKK